MLWPFVSFPPRDAPMRQLVKTSRQGLLLKEPPDLRPALRPAYLEVLALGVRGMQPFEMLPIQMPYMQIQANLGVVEM